MGFAFVAMANSCGLFEDSYQRGTEIPVRLLFSISLYKV
jgi:hypothetical protein